jgi:hypothetical protein
MVTYRSSLSRLGHRFCPGTRAKIGATIDTRRVPHAHQASVDQDVDWTTREAAPEVTDRDKTGVAWPRITVGLCLCVASCPTCVGAVCGCGLHRF